MTNQSMIPEIKYTGKVQPTPGQRDSKGNLEFPYIPSDELVDMVNLAIRLERPLLVKGEPGCGKTKLGYAVASELSLDCWLWPVKSTSRARDGAYVYDSIARLRDAQLAAAGRLSPTELARAEDANTYVRWGPLGQAFNSANKSVLIIDEIDKADIDFPNDLLLELDELRFVVDETGLEIRAKQAPLVIVTSNDEKDLPDAFLRRCLFHYIPFPDRDQLALIMRHRYADISNEFLDAVLNRFLDLRSEMSKDKHFSKRVSTGELMDWIRVLRWHPEDKVLTDIKTKLLYPGVLLKSWDDLVLYRGLAGD